VVLVVVVLVVAVRQHRTVLVERQIQVEVAEGLRTLREVVVLAL
jgi:hypothetical protein